MVGNPYGPKPERVFRLQKNLGVEDDRWVGKFHSWISDPSLIDRCIIPPSPDSFFLRNKCHAKKVAIFHTDASCESWPLWFWREQIQLIVKIQVEAIKIYIKLT
ncbi:hypothetical protein CDAR_239121 [Caerostris darwini]|uniref:Uncharacterized protein n=1 Tax=Caerostris darwini TaxID=1538125 RepID=A0AAV4NYI3_9ARAC|nr:hypothetical protein CDAR_239121 [Caerostris darwini]